MIVISHLEFHYHEVLGEKAFKTNLSHGPQFFLSFLNHNDSKSQEKGCQLWGSLFLGPTCLLQIVEEAMFVVKWAFCTDRFLEFIFS